MSEQRTIPWAAKELAEVAGVTPVYVRKLCQAGKIEGAYKVGRDWLIPAEEGRAWLENRRSRWEKY